MKTIKHLMKPINLLSNGEALKTVNLFISRMILLGIFFFFFSRSAHSQGCSDAGICSIASGRLSDSLDENVSSLNLGYIFGIGLENTVYNGAFVGFVKNFKGNWGLSSRITYNHAKGELGTVAGPGDCSILLNTQKRLNSVSLLKPSLGIKIPLSRADYQVNGNALPLEYQPGLGTYDALLGLEFNYKTKWSVDAALQLPFINVNRNAYFAGTDTSIIFPSTNLFNRKADLLLRFSYNLWSKNKQWYLRPFAMGIYHLANDTYVDQSNNTNEIIGSKGLTVNLGIMTDFIINPKNSLRLNLAGPVKVREIRPDGLTRSFLTSLTYKFNF